MGSEKPPTKRDPWRRIVESDLRAGVDRLECGHAVPITKDSGRKRRDCPECGLLSAYHLNRDDPNMPAEYHARAKRAASAALFMPDDWNPRE
jgi:hypothetical protein